MEVDFGRPMGHEPAKRRPALVVSNDGLNHHAGQLVVCPFTTRPARYPSEVSFPAGVLRDPSTLCCQQIRLISGGRVLRVQGQIVDPVLRRRVHEALMDLFGIGGGQP